MFSTAKRFAEKMEGKLYFAYGSNMDASQMNERCPEAKLVGKATLKNYSFLINERGVASIVPDSEQIVHGLVWTLRENDEVELDFYESVKTNVYTKEKVTVIDEETNLEIDALIYIATNNNLGKPYPGYLERIITGAKEAKFDSEYIAQLSKWF